MRAEFAGHPDLPPDTFLSRRDTGFRVAMKGGDAMRHSIRLGVGTAVVAGALALGAGPALADAGAPGTTFPEQPPAVPGCEPVTTNPGTGPGGQAVLNFSDTAAGITGGLLTDACFGG